MLRGPDPFRQNPKEFGGLKSPKWPSHLFPNDEAWKINPERVDKGRALYAKICVECHLGPVNDPAFDTQFPDKSFWKSKQWKQDPNGGWVLDEVQKPVAHMGTDPAQAKVLQKRKVRIPGFLDLQPARDLGERWKCKNMPNYSSTDMPFSIALMIVVDKVSQKWLKDKDIKEPGPQRIVGAAKQLSQSRRDTGETALSRAAAERRLGDRALSAQRFGALALLDAQARGRASEAVLHGRARLRSGAGRIPGGCRRRCSPARPAKPCSR